MYHKFGSGSEKENQNEKSRPPHDHDQFDDLRNRVEATEVTMIEELEVGFSDYEHKLVNLTSKIRLTAKICIYLFLGVLFCATFIKSIIEYYMDATIYMTRSDKEMKFGEGTEDIPPAVFVCTFFEGPKIKKNITQSRFYKMGMGGNMDLEYPPSSFTSGTFILDKSTGGKQKFGGKHACAFGNYPPRRKLGGGGSAEGWFPWSFSVDFDILFLSNDAPKLHWMTLVNKEYVDHFSLSGKPAEDVYHHVLTHGGRTTDSMFSILEGDSYYSFLLTKTYVDNSVDLLDLALVGFLIHPRIELIAVRYDILDKSASGFNAPGCMGNKVPRRCKATLTQRMKFNGKTYVEVVERSSRKDQLVPLYAAGGVLSGLTVFTGTFQQILDCVLRKWYLGRVGKRRKKKGKKEEEEEEEEMEEDLGEEDGTLSLMSGVPGSSKHSIQ